MQEVCSLLSTAPLEVFQIYSTGPFVESLATDDFWRNMAAIHCARLTRFSVHRMLISLDAIDNLCQTCTALEQLFVVVEQHSLVIYYQSDLLPRNLNSMTGSTFDMLIKRETIACCSHKLPS